jgi:thiol-disulfide isomerase/thioredoxin
MRQHILWLWLVSIPLSASGQFFGPSNIVKEPSIDVVDEEGNAVPKFEVMTHTPNNGYESWAVGSDGRFTFKGLNTFLRSANKVDLLIRSNDHAPVVRSFSNEELTELRSHGAKLTLERGREVRLKLNPPSGSTLPADLSPEFYFEDFAWRVEMMWQPRNRQNRVPDFNLLGATRTSNGEYVIRLPSKDASFFVGVYHPGWLRYFKAGPFTSRDFANGELAINLPRPGTLAVKLDWSQEDSQKLPFAGIDYRIARQNPTRGTVWVAATSETGLDGPPLEVNDLAPGDYSVTVSTKPKVENAVGQEREINPGRFSARTQVTLESEQSIHETIRWNAFDPEALRGNRSARVRIFDADGKPAAGKQLHVEWSDGHYGSLPVFDGPVGADGVVALNGITETVNRDLPFGPFTVSVDGNRLGFFRISPAGPTEEFTFGLLPNTGTLAPDIELIQLKSGERVRLKQFRGQIVYLEFWETTCGPCQPPMARLNELVRTQATDWEGKVALVPLCLDRDPNVISTHINTRGWTNLRHYRSERSNDEYFTDAQRAFAVMSYPTAFLIDRDGKIVWRGHPAEQDVVTQVQNMERKR